MSLAQAHAGRVSNRTAMPEVQQSRASKSAEAGVAKWEVHRHSALHEVVDAAALHEREVFAAVDAEDSITYARLAHDSMCLAQVLLHRGLVRALDQQPLGTFVQRGCRWLLLYVATMRCGVPVMAMSVDLSDRAAEARRNLEVFQIFVLQCVVFAESAPGVAEILQVAREKLLPVVSLLELVSAAESGAIVPMPLPAVRPDALLAYCYTGGTTRAAKAVRIAHAMALHETEHYVEVLPEGLRGASMRFLQNSSAYWGAALLGQIDVALAMEGTSVICNAGMPSEIVETIRRFEVTAFGAVPSVLAHFSPSDVPTVQCVFAWAEDLPEAVASLWLGRVALRDLLIATEYWLAFYSSRETGRSLQIVDGLDVQILVPEEVKPVARNGIGEVCISGPTVSPGYVDSSEDAERFFEFADGRRYFRTRDLARWVEPGKRLEYCGRCDDMAKVGGKWVDLSKLEEAVCGIPGVREAKLVFASSRRQAFVVLAKEADEQHRALGTIQQLLPTRTAVHALATQRLPRHAATGKVDSQKLLRAVTEDPYAAAGTGRLDGMLSKRRRRVISTFTRTWRCVAKLCHHDSRRMLCLAYIWYGLIISKEYRYLQEIFDKYFPLQGGVYGVIFAWVRSLPLTQLQQIAAPGAALACKDGRGVHWVWIFWATLPHWLTDSSNHLTKQLWTYTVEHACERTLRYLQKCEVKRNKPTCSSCRRHVVSLFPSLEHCCNACPASGGQHHDAACLRQDRDGWRKCMNCEYGATWDLCFCCSWCSEDPGKHGHCCERLLPSPPWPADAIATEAPSPAQAELKAKEAELRAKEAEDKAKNDVEAKLEAELQAKEVVFNSKEAPGDAMAEVDEAIVENIAARIIGAPLPSAGPEVGNGNHTKELPSLDSLRALRLLAAIQQELNRTLSLHDISDCQTVAELTVRIRNAPLEASSDKFFQAPGRDGFRIWTFAWRNCLPWLLQCKSKLDKGVVLAAVRRLMKQQPALRSQLIEPWPVHVAFMETAAVMEVLRATFRSMMPQAKAGQHVLTTLAKSVKHCWPRLCSVPMESRPEETAFTEVACSLEDVPNRVQKLANDWKGPFQIVLLSHPDLEEGATGQSNGDTVEKISGQNSLAAACHILVIVSHAVADGSAFIPLLYDLEQLLGEEEEKASKMRFDSQHSKRRVQRLPHFGAILEDRLLRTLDGDESHEDIMFLERRMDFFDHYFPETSCKGYCQFFRVMASETEELQRIADRHVAGSKIYLVLLALVVISLARINGKSSVSFTLVHHGRDHPPAAANVIGFFTDFRTLTVPTSELNSLLGVLHFVAAAVRERNWRRPGALELIDTLVNIVPSHFGAVGDLAQVPPAGVLQQQWKDTDLWQDSRTRNFRRELDFQIEQVDATVWNVNMYMDEETYPKEKGRQFRAAWFRVLRDLREDPLQGVLADPAAGGVMSILRGSNQPF